jgi:hypothetical protein
MTTARRGASRLWPEFNVAKAPRGSGLNPASRGLAAVAAAASHSPVFTP